MDTFETWRNKCNQVFAAVDASETAISDLSELSDDVGNVDELQTTNKTLVSAINELHSLMNSIIAHVGDMSNLQTTANENLVLAVNELKDRIDSL